MVSFVNSGITILLLLSSQHRGMDQNQTFFCGTAIPLQANDGHDRAQGLPHQSCHDHTSHDPTDRGQFSVLQQHQRTLQQCPASRASLQVSRLSSSFRSLCRIGLAASDEILTPLLGIHGGYSPVSPSSTSYENATALLSLL